MAASRRDIRVDTAARPVSASLLIVMARSDENEGGLRLSAEYKFSEWGVPVTIVPPSVIAEH
ncbi:MAG: hypothetical protein M3N29_07065 [Chloroflexota bacterium]|nr:hypothetical protein [Chloroflexota bacterium]